MAKTLKEIFESFDFNRAAIAKQRLQNLRHQGRKVRGARIANLMRAAGLREEEMDETDLDQLDEVLSADATASDWIHDFVHSTNPKFEGKSKKERIKMALGAYYHKSRHKDGEGLGEAVNKSDVPAYLRKKTGDQLTTKDLEKERTQNRSHPETIKKINGTVQEEKDTVVKDKEGKVVSWKHEGDWKKSTKKNPEGKVHNLAGMALKKTKSMTNEEVELTEAVKTTHEDPLVTVHDKDGLHTHANLSTANHIFNTKVKHTDVHAGPVKTKDGHETKRDLTFAISKHHEIEMKKEEFEQFISQLQLEEEVVNQVLEAAKQYAGLEKEDKPGKIKTAVVKTHANAVESETVEGWKDEKKPVKEQYDEEGNIVYEKVSFSSFMEGMTATQVRPGVTRYTGGSYGSAKGAKYGNTDYDNEDIEKKDDEGQEQQKRGRGRPAGSKSGARGPRIK
jgi:hypothetical protein